MSDLSGMLVTTMEKEKLVSQLVEDLVSMHKVGAIELEYWETARLLVDKYYNVNYTAKVEIGDKK